MERADWLKHRKGGVGASDCPAIMGVSPYNTAMDIYLDKTTDYIEEKSNFVMELGNRLEPIARSYYEILNDADFPPSNFVNATHPHYRCSLDGYNVESNKAIEIKYCGKTFTETCPDKYYPQIQYQYAVTGSLSIDLVQIDNMNRINIIHVPKNNEYITELLRCVDLFWYFVLNKKEDEMRVFSDNMYITVDGITYRLGAGNLKKSLKLIKGMAYKLHKLHDGEFSDYLGLCNKYGKKK